MSIWLILMLAAGSYVDIPGTKPLRLPATSVDTATSFAGTQISLVPVISIDQQNQDQQQGGATPQPPKPATKLSEPNKLELIRYVSGEYAKAVRALPGGKDGFILFVDEPLNERWLNIAVATHGAAINLGDNVQITKLDFREHTIVVDLNGGGKGHRRWRDGIQVGISGIPTTTVTPDNGPPGLQQGTGSTLFIEFKKSIPNLSPEEMKRLLSPFLDFAKQRSASVTWVDTLPPDIKKAIQDRKPAVGMDREQLVAAMGKPDHKVRERDTDGNEIEDWIYGQPPSKTVFVRFMGDRVTKIEQFPR
jgi:hypothetical protein